jgi:hypothetical protein
MTCYPLSSGVYYQESTIRLTGRDSYLTIKAYNDEPVTISGGILLDNPINDWVIDGQIRTATFPLSSCGELFQGKNRLLPAKSPNVEWGSNKNIASGEYHYMKVRLFYLLHLCMDHAIFEVLKLASNFESLFSFDFQLKKL